MFEAPSALFSGVGMFYGLTLPIGILLLITVLFVPSLAHSAGVKPMALGKAVYSYLLQATGILLMTLGGLPALYSVVARTQYEASAYLGLLVLFACGGFTFLWHDHAARDLEPAARAVPHAIYLFTFKMMGYVLTLLSILSLVLTILLGMPSEPNWWIMPTLLLLDGLLLSWCTRDQKAPSPFKAPAKGKKK
ncbi:hypothetical protein A2706_02205 [Candidatus Peribacteria bacterium RIFCSPHIGHO2_01_FULL_51_35]|nr:MAG: hypothetical protein A2706_02205 [Candidatus Peribacteria bacterium RIFCSPHIGHO2_01_FULL_51_35]